MAISITFHGERPRTGPGSSIDALGPQDGDAVSVTDNYTFLKTGLYRCRATAAHTVRFGESSLNSATGGEGWASGDKEVRWFAAGQKVYVA